jgi:site-specific recombinase XerD
VTPSVSHLAVIAARTDNRGVVAVELVERAREYADAAQAPNTRAAYAGDLADFQAFCHDQGYDALPALPQTVAAYVTDRAGSHKLATIRRRLAGIANAHREHGLESPTTHEIVRRVVKGIGRTIGAPQRRKTALTLPELRAILLAIRGDDLKAKRDRAVILLAFSAALRRSEIAALDVEDLCFSREGLRVTVRRSKTDQEGSGQEIAVPMVKSQGLCAATAVRDWLTAASITEGPLFRTFTLRREMKNRRIYGKAVARLVETLASKAHLEGDYSAHSLRAGFVTACAKAGVGLDRIAMVTRHKSLTVLSTYVRRANLFDDAPLSQIVA